MWEILHWIFLCYMKPNPCMHLIAALCLWIMQYFLKGNLTKKDIIPALCIFGTYAAFYIQPSLEHFAFQPWWVVSITGLRYREFLIWCGGVYVGIYLYVSSISNIVSHVMMNICTMMKIRKISLKSRAIVHLVCMLIYANDPKITDVGYIDFLAGASAVVCGLIQTQSDTFSMAMIFTSPMALSTFFLHALEPNWYQFYKNNHFKRVKNTYYFIYPIAIVLLALGYNFGALKNFSVYGSLF